MWEDDGGQLMALNLNMTFGEDGFIGFSVPQGGKPYPVSVSDAADLELLVPESIGDNFAGTIDLSMMMSSITLIITIQTC